MFKDLEGDVAILNTKGTYRVAGLAHMDGMLFAKQGSSYLRIYANGATSKEGTSLEKMATDAPLFQDKFGRLAVTPAEDRKVVLLSGDGKVQPLLSIAAE